MFLGSDIIEFINKIIDSKETQNDDKIQNIKQFKEYLRLTKMADEETLKCIDKILKCMPEILILKQKLGSFDLNTILKEEKVKIEKTDQAKAKKLVKSYEDRHYNHYQTSSSDACGASSRVNNSRC